MYETYRYLQYVLRQHVAASTNKYPLRETRIRQYSVLNNTAQSSGRDMMLSTRMNMYVYIKYHEPARGLHRPCKRTN